MLSDAMKKLLADDKAWSFMSRNAIKFASLMSWDKAVRSYLYVYINAARDNTVKQEMNWYRYDG
jgi:glycogen synthase